MTTLSCANLVPPHLFLVPQPTPISSPGGKNRAGRGLTLVQFKMANGSSRENRRFPRALGRRDPSHRSNPLIKLMGQALTVVLVVRLRLTRSPLERMAFKRERPHGGLFRREKCLVNDLTRQTEAPMRRGNAADLARVRPVASPCFSFHGRRVEIVAKSELVMPFESKLKSSGAVRTPRFDGGWIHCQEGDLAGDQVSGTLANSPTPPGGDTASLSTLDLDCAKIDHDNASCSAVVFFCQGQRP